MGHTPFPQQLSLLLLSSPSSNGALASRLGRSLDRPVERITAPALLTPNVVPAVDPQWIFVLDWSLLIPESIWGISSTVIFHMNEQLHGRGVSARQNLIQRGHISTMFMALLCGVGRHRFKARQAMERPAALAGCS